MRSVRVRSTMLWVLFGASVSVLAAQSTSQDEWEKRTFVKQPPDKVMDAAGIRAGMVVGEVGAGRGRFTMPLARRVGPTGKILANDVDAAALAVLARRAKEAGYAHVETILGQGDDPRFPPRSLDVAFMVWVYHYVEPKVAVGLLRRLGAALKPGGTVVLVEPDFARSGNSEGHAVTPERLRREAEATGFELVRTETFLPEDTIYILRPKAR